MTKVQQHAEDILRSLNKSVSSELEKKRCLGQYAVVWRKGKVEYLFNKDNNKANK